MTQTQLLLISTIKHNSVRKFAGRLKQNNKMLIFCLLTLHLTANTYTLTFTLWRVLHAKSVDLEAITN